MNRLLFGWLALVLTACAAGLAYAEPIVIATDPSSDFQYGSNSSGRWAGGPRDSYQHLQSTYDLERRGLTNRLSWEFVERSELHAVLDIESEIFSSFEPEHDSYICGRDGVCTWVHFDDRYEETDMIGRIPLETSQPTLVTVTIRSEAIEGTPFFRLGYFNRAVIYAADPMTGELAPPTTMVPDLATDNPIDVQTFVDRFAVPAGSHFLTLEMQSSHAVRGILFDASVEVQVVFSALPEPTSASLLLFACGSFLASGRR